MLLVDGRSLDPLPEPVLREVEIPASRDRRSRGTVVLYHEHVGRVGRQLRLSATGRGDGAVEEGSREAVAAAPGEPL